MKLNSSPLIILKKCFVIDAISRDANFDRFQYRYILLFLLTFPLASTAKAGLKILSKYDNSLYECIMVYIKHSGILSASKIANTS